MGKIEPYSDAKLQNFLNKVTNGLKVSRKMLLERSRVAVKVQAIAYVYWMVDGGWWMMCGSGGVVAIPKKYSTFV